MPYPVYGISCLGEGWGGVPCPSPVRGQGKVGDPVKVLAGSRGVVRDTLVLVLAGVPPLPPVDGQTK